MSTKCPRCASSEKAFELCDADLDKARAETKTYKNLFAHCEATHDCNGEDCGKCDNCERAKLADEIERLRGIVEGAIPLAINVLGHYNPDGPSPIHKEAVVWLSQARIYLGTD